MKISSNVTVLISLYTNPLRLPGTDCSSSNKCDTDSYVQLSTANFSIQNASSTDMMFVCVIAEIGFSLAS